jgi:hypothetical protein
MRARRIGSTVLLPLVLAIPSFVLAEDGRSVPKPPPGAAAKAERVSTQLELQIEFLMPLARYSGTAHVTAVDPRFVLGGKVVWVQHADVMALHSRPAFAIHSPTRLGLHGAARGATICLLLARNIRDEKVYWELSAVKPDAGCRGGG